VRQSITLLTSSNQFLNFQNTALNGEQVTVAVTNTSSTNVQIVLQTNQVTTVFYDPTVASNRNSFTVAANAIAVNTFVHSTNFGNNWILYGTIGKELELSAGPGISLSTNSTASTVSLRAGGSIFTAYTADTGSPKTNIIIDASLGGLFRVALTNNMGLILTNGYDGQELNIELYQDGTGNRTVTHVPSTGGNQTNNWNFGQDITSPILLTTNQYQMDMIKLRFLDTSVATNTCRSNWLVIGTLHKFSQ
jgi:hypothetical protein